MRQVFNVLWSEWEDEFDPLEVEPGDYALVVRAQGGSEVFGYDAVPVKVSRETSSVPADAGPEQVFELFGLLD